MYVGVDYYPEHWPRDRWDYDADLMRQASFNIVRLAEFAWSKMEPEEGRFEFEWLDDALSVLQARGISAILGTPTAVAPAWMALKFPEIQAENNAGRRLAWGVRKSYCPTSETFRMLSRRVTTAMAEHYAGHPAVIGWQTDNELEGPVCYCSSCLADFQGWLDDRYGSIDALNTAWGTHFWGHTYRSFAEIQPPENFEHYNPGLCLDWLRHHSWRTVRFQRDQVDILRRICPGQFVTHNLMGFWNGDINSFDLADDLDFPSLDVYPIWSDVEIPYDAAAAGDLMRGVKKRSYWVMEATAGPCGWSAFGRDPYPGEIRKVAFQQLAHGADGHLWFRWRTCTAGREQYWHGLLGHDGKPMRRYDEAARTAREYHKLASLLDGTTVQPQVAVIYDVASRWAVRIQPGYEGNDYYHALMRWYRALFRAGVNVDIVPANADLSEYKAVFAPHLHVLPDTIADRITNYVEAGGVFVTDCRTGVKTETNLCYDRTLPGRLTDVLGIRIEEYGAHKLEIPVEGAGKIAGSYTSQKYNDWIRLESAEALASYKHWHLGPYPAATLNRFGKGQAYYVGTVAKEDGFYDRVVGAVLEEARVSAPLTPPPGVEVAVRSGNGKQIVFVLNHNEAEVEVTVPAAYRNALSGEMVARSVSMAPFDVIVLVGEGAQ